MYGQEIEHGKSNWKFPIFVAKWLCIKFWSWHLRYTQLNRVIAQKQPFQCKVIPMNSSWLNKVNILHNNKEPCWVLQPGTEWTSCWVPLSDAAPCWVWNTVDRTFILFPVRLSAVDFICLNIAENCWALACAVVNWFHAISFWFTYKDPDKDNFGPG